MGNATVIRKASKSTRLGSAAACMALVLGCSNVWVDGESSAAPEGVSNAESPTAPAPTNNANTGHDSPSTTDSSDPTPAENPSNSGNASGGAGSGTLDTPNNGAGSTTATSNPSDTTSDSISNTPVTTPADPGPSDITFEVRSDRDVHAISPHVYGTNGAKDLATNRQTLVRLGGNRWTAYNWENNASNAGNDYNFQNDAYLSSSNAPAAAVGPQIDQAQAAGAATLVTIPILDYVAADKKGDGDVRNSGGSYLNTRFKQNKPSKGSALGNPDPNDAFVYQDEFVNHLKTTRPNANILFSLDNEPDLWSSTHSEIHPQNVGYDELCERNVTYAKVVKSVWPSAKVLGSVNYGWYGFLNLQDAPDAAGKGEYLDYYLNKMKSAETAAGKRLIDYLDLHWYPEAQGSGVRITGSDTSPAVVAARLQAPRSLWDSTYNETSWVSSSLNTPLQLIRRVKTKIEKSYPGTALGFSEWNYGGGGHISGAIATADVLGIFGRENVGLANFWALNSDESFTYAAFRIYRNFDGAGGTFGDTSIFASTSDTTNSSVYASVDGKNPDRLVVIVINKANATKTAALKVAHPGTFTKASVYTLTSAAAKVSAASDLIAIGTNAFRYAMPALSVSVLVFKK